MEEQRDQGVKCLEVKMREKVIMCIIRALTGTKHSKSREKSRNILEHLILIKGLSNQEEDIEFIRLISETSRNMATRCCYMKRLRIFILSISDSFLLMNNTLHLPEEKVYVTILSTLSISIALFISNANLLPELILHLKSAFPYGCPPYMCMFVPPPILVAMS